ncbi:MAG: nucleotidyl transferase AbiEii/AbiGii toxin family protein [Candidatus Micrarchaeaceae archaeon]
MLDPDELIAVGTYEQPYQQEKDYLEELFLGKAFNCCSGLAFKGGTSLSKFYGSVRFSDDLDFSLNSPKAENIGTKIDSMINKLSAEMPIKLMRKLNTPDALKYELSIRGPLFARMNRYQHLKLEIGMRESIIEPTNIFRRNPIYRDLEPYIAIVMNEKEILAEKIVALLFRQNLKARDLYDIYFLLRKGVEIRVGLIDVKMKEYGHAFTKERFYKRLGGISRVWDKELERLLPKKEFINYKEATALVVKQFTNAALL